MSLAINPDGVLAVLISNEWIHVKPGTFDMDSYEYVVPSEASERDEDFVLHGGGNSGICATGFRFICSDGIFSGRTICGPLTSIKAVSCI
jgi:hypothetical protein